MPHARRRGSRMYRRTPTSAQVVNYVQIKKYLLAIVPAREKSYSYIYDRDVRVPTNHKVLIFNKQITTASKNDTKITELRLHVGVQAKEKL